MKWTLVHLLHSHTWICETYIECSQLIYRKHRNPETQKHLRLLSSGSKLFITFEFKVIRHKESDTQSFYADFSISPPPSRAAPRRKLLVWSRRAPKVNRLLRTLKFNSLTFLKSPKSAAHAFGAWRHSHPPVTFTLWDFYLDISEWHILPARAWTPAFMLHLSNLCAKWKVLSLTKPKVKIYKTKSLGHYITHFIKVTKKVIT